MQGKAPSSRFILEIWLQNSYLEIGNKAFPIFNKITHKNCISWMQGQTGQRSINNHPSKNSNA